jgi:hypothetical protein
MGRARNIPSAPHTRTPPALAQSALTTVSSWRASASAGGLMPLTSATSAGIGTGVTDAVAEATGMKGAGEGDVELELETVPSSSDVTLRTSGRFLPGTGEGGVPTVAVVVMLQHMREKDTELSTLDGTESSKPLLMAHLGDCVGVCVDERESEWLGVCEADVVEVVLPEAAQSEGGRYRCTVSGMKTRVQQRVRAEAPEDPPDTLLLRELVVVAVTEGDAVAELETGDAVFVELQDAVDVRETASTELKRSAGPGVDGVGVADREAEVVTFGLDVTVTEAVGETEAEVVGE